MTLRAAMPAMLQVPGLAVVLAGVRKDSQTYVRNKKKACEEVGIISFGADLPEDVSEEELLKVGGSDQRWHACTRGHVAGNMRLSVRLLAGWRGTPCPPSFCPLPPGNMRLPVRLLAGWRAPLPAHLPTPPKDPTCIYLSAGCLVVHTPICPGGCHVK